MYVYAGLDQLVLFVKHLEYTVTGIFVLEMSMFGETLYALIKLHVNGKEALNEVFENVDTYQVHRILPYRIIQVSFDSISTILKEFKKNLLSFIQFSSLCYVLKNLKCYCIMFYFNF